MCVYVGEKLIEQIKDKTDFQQDILKLKIKTVQSVGPAIATIKFKIF